MDFRQLSNLPAIHVLRKTFSQWNDDNALRLSAALAYYSIFSIAPILIIAISIAGWVFGQEPAQGLLFEQLRGLLGNQAAEGVQSMIQSANKPATSLAAGLTGAVALLFGASGVFGQLKDALNTIWGVRAKPGLGLAGFIRERLLSFGMVIVIGFLLLVSLFMTATVSTLGKIAGGSLPEPVAQVLTSLASFAVVTMLFAAIFKVLPDAKIKWNDVWIGAGATAILFEVGKVLLGIYLGRESTASPYGAAGSAILLLLWVYYASLILFFGAEFTQVFAQARGERIEPSPNAERLSAPGQGEPDAKSGEPEMARILEEPRKESLQQYFPASESKASGWLTPEDKKNVGLLFAALAGGFAVGLVTRHKEEVFRSPQEEVLHGSKALAAAGAAAALAFASRVLSKGERVIDRGLERLHGEHELHLQARPTKKTK